MAVANKILEIVFNTEDTTKTFTLQIKNPKEDLTLDAVKTVADFLINKKAFITSGGNLKSFKTAHVRVTSVTDLAQEH